MARYRRTVAWGALCLVVGNGLSVLGPEILRRAVDRIREGVRGGDLAPLALLLVGITLAEGICRYFTRTALIGVSRRIEFDLRNDLFAHLARLSLRFFRRHRTGDLMARATNDVDAVRGMLGPGFMYGLDTIVQGPAVVVLMAVRDPWVTLLALVPFPVMTLAVRALGRHVHERSNQVQQGYARLTTLAQENLAGMRVVKASAREAEEIRTFGEASQDYVGRNLRLARASALYSPVVGLPAGLSAMAVLGFGGLRVVSGHLTLGDLVALMAYVMMLTWPMMALGWVAGLFERGLASLKRLGEILDERPDIGDPPEPVPVASLRGEIVFDHVTFAHNGEPVLDDVSFRVPAGTTTAVVGRTGSGKSTLLALIARLFDVQRGRILVDGLDVRAFALRDLRGAIGYVPQETFLFSASLRENILFGAGERAGEERFLRAVDASRLGRDVDQFPQGYDTLVGERGVTLSGGEKQRTALSRALVREPAIYLLDDPVASVDVRTEEEMLRGLAEMTRGKTTLLVSHRLSAIRGADQILVLDRGRIVERGGYVELLARGGVFSEIHRRQEILMELERE